MVLLLVSAVFVETHYIGRLAMASNIFLLWQLLGAKWYNLPDFFQLYLNLGLIAAVIATVSYIFNQSLPAGFYNIGRVFFGSLSIIAIILYFL